jgi:glycosyltransferase involved in cell wall biosynthesis
MIDADESVILHCGTMPGPTLKVALATFNGYRFVAEFLDSLVAQTYHNFEVIVSDDGSTDGTLDVVRNYVGRLSIKILDDQSRKGVVSNFGNSLRECNDGYIIPADQDDVWQPSKIEQMVKAMAAAEKRFGSGVPILVFSDLELVAEDMSSISPSFYLATLKSPFASQFKDFILDNHIPGCAMILNRPLLDLSLPFPEISAHDWWIALLAAACGKIIYLPQPLIRYRQHSTNTIGAGNAGASFVDKGIRNLAHPVAFVRSRRLRAKSQAKAIEQNLKAFQLRVGQQASNNDMSLLHTQLYEPSYLRVVKSLSDAHTGMRKFDQFLTQWFLVHHDRSTRKNSRLGL